MVVAVAAARSVLSTAVVRGHKVTGVIPFASVQKQSRFSVCK